MIVTGSSDKSLKVLDINRGFDPIRNMKCTDSI